MFEDKGPASVEMSPAGIFGLPPTCGVRAMTKDLLISQREGGHLKSDENVLGEKNASRLLVDRRKTVRDSTTYSDCDSRSKKATPRELCAM